jgi:sodium-independent sulfate anion transporter 11
MASNPTTSKIGQAFAKVLGIKLQYRNPTGEINLTRGESVFSVSTADTYLEDEPSSLDWIKQVTPTRHTFTDWFYHLFPFTHWIGRYNGTWLIGDLIAG